MKIRKFNESRIPKNLYDKLSNIAGKVKDYIAGAKAEEIDTDYLNDLDDLIYSNWDDSIEINKETLEYVKKLIGNIDDIKPYW